MFLLHCYIRCNSNFQFDDHETFGIFRAPVNTFTVPVTASRSRRHLRSAACGDLQVLACHTSSFGPRSFAACAPKLWNSTTVTSGSYTFTDLILQQAKNPSFWFGLRARTHDCLGC